MRIRYERFMEGIVGGDVEIVAHPIADLIGKPLNYDAYLFCKTFTLEAIILAHAAKRQGKIVAQDLFDDYFSQSTDQRLFIYRDWLRAMAPLTDVVLCTTRRMKAVIQPFLPECPITVIEDPITDYDPFRIAALADRKTDRARMSRTLRIAWFGIGDNPYFSVGLSDLTAPAVITQLAALAKQGWQSLLTVATNLRALDVNGLALLRNIPIPVELIEWTEAVEQKVLADADVALLPVSSQGFSRAKSLNRALTALNQGCQIWSLGEPLYEELEPFIYRSSAVMLSDLDSERPRIRSETVPELTHFLGRTANAFQAGRTFASAILGKDSPPIPSPFAVIHGWQTTVAIHKLTSGQGGLSVKSPYCGAAWNFPVRFDAIGQDIVVKVSTRLAPHYGIPVHPQASEKIGDFEFATVMPDAYPPLPRISAATGAPLRNVASYGDVMESIRCAIRALLPGTLTYVSDLSSFRTVASGHG